MTITEFLTLFSTVKPTKKGWDVCCPAHDDQSPSLGIMEGEEGRIVLNCFAGCTPEAICTSLGLTLAHLFQDMPQADRLRLVKPWRPVPKDKLAWAYELHALDLRLIASRIVNAATQCEDYDCWSPTELELAMHAVSLAYRYQERATFCEEYADHLRETEYELRRLASAQS